MESKDNFKPSKKHLAIFKTIAEKGYYKPAYSDQEPATQTLIKKGIVEWRPDFKGLELTEHGKKFVAQTSQPIDVLAEAIKESNARVTFGLQPRHIEIIEKHINKFEGAKYSYHIWQDIGKEIGWDSLTAALYYFRNNNEELALYKKDFEDAAGELMINITHVHAHSDLSKVISANSILRQRVAKLEREHGKNLIGVQIDLLEDLKSEIGDDYRRVLNDKISTLLKQLETYNTDEI